MSWDEKDWAHIWITGMPERFGENSDNISNINEKGERIHSIFECSRDVEDVSWEKECKLRKIAQKFGVMIEFQYLNNPIYRFDYRDSNPLISIDEIKNHNLIQEVILII